MQSCEDGDVCQHVPNPPAPSPISPPGGGTGGGGGNSGGHEPDEDEGGTGPLPGNCDGYSVDSCEDLSLDRDDLIEIVSNARSGADFYNNYSFWSGATVGVATFLPGLFMSIGPACATSGPGLLVCLGAIVVFGTITVVTTAATSTFTGGVKAALYQSVERYTSDVLAKDSSEQFDVTITKYTKVPIVLPGGWAPLGGVPVYTISIGNNEPVVLYGTYSTEVYDSIFGDLP